MVTVAPAAGAGLGGLLGPLGSFGIGLFGKKNYGIPMGTNIGDFLRQKQQGYQTPGLTSSDPGINRFPLDWLIKMAPTILGTLNKNEGNRAAPGTPGSVSDPTGGINEGGIDWMKILLPILAATAGGLQNRSQTAESTSTTAPVFSPEDAVFKNQLMSKYQSYLDEDPNLKGYEANQLGQLNRAYGLRQQDLQGDLASRGISGPAAELAIQNLGNERFQQATQFKNMIPLLSRDLRQQALTSASGFFNTLPYGQNIQSTQKQAGNILGGITGGLAEMLAAMYGLNMGRK